MLPQLDPEALHVLTFGPGVGELVLVHAPPGVWMVIDGCASGGKAYGPRVLEHYGAIPSIILFTHPHLDHARGVAQVVDDATQGAVDTWPLIGMLPLYEAMLGGQDPSSSAAERFNQGVTSAAVAAILDRWERSDACRWAVGFGDTRPLGDTTVQVLAPHQYALDQAKQRLLEGRAPNWNTVSTAVLIEWGRRHFLLGADLVQDPYEGWERAHLELPTLLRHNGMKVPHHGSMGALWIKVHQGRVPGIITPFAPSGLPSFEGDGGVRYLQSGHVEVSLTALPRAHTTQAGTPIELRREDLAAPGPLRFDPKTPGFPDCFVITSLTAERRSVTYGPGSVRILPHA